STIFNALTGENQHVGNWPGKTVAQKAGTLIIDDTKITIVDLPGTYSLSAYSPEEVIARDFILNERPSLVVTVIDAANLERNLYLTVQVIELGIPVIIALNMADLASERGLHINTAKLSHQLGVPVITTIASEGKGLSELIDCIIKIAPVKEQGVVATIAVNDDVSCPHCS
ncbi:MAG: ferrous iron transporter B, partial [Chloroflexi bacterium]|nr:ferrous iron transporter B [Chloroflexota bacterium]